MYLEYIWLSNGNQHFPKVYKWVVFFLSLCKIAAHVVILEKFQRTECSFYDLSSLSLRVTLRDLV